MAISWSDFINGETLSSIRAAINSFNSSVVTDVNANTSAIATNTSNISTLATAVSANTTDIATLQTYATFVPVYKYASATNVTAFTDAYANVLTMSESVSAGTYKLELSMLYSLNSVTNSCYFRFSTDGGTNWTEINIEPKDITNILPLSYSTTVVHGGGTFSMIIQAKKESAADTLTVATINSILERKL